MNMSCAVGVMSMPADFRYRDVFLKGKPKHERFDIFRAKHPTMDPGKRAKIFAPFDALRGFSAAIIAKNAIYDYQREISEDDQAELDRRLTILHNLTWNSRMARENRVRVTVTHYAPCEDKNSEAYRIKGQYQTLSGICMKVDTEVEQMIQIDDRRIMLENILQIESPDGIFRKNAFWDIWPDETGETVCVQDSI